MNHPHFVGALSRNVIKHILRKSGMRYLSDSEEAEATTYMGQAANIAKSASCDRHKCGSVIVNNGKIIGRGFNSPPAGLEEQRRCSYPKESYNKKVTDKTCCMHAEQRAIMDALRNDPDKLRGSSIYFTRLGKDGSTARSGKPYCTICSKMSLDAGIKEFILWHEEGICAYAADEYNTLSYQYKE